MDRRRIMVAANAARAAVLAVATALAALGLMNLWVLLTAVFLACVSEVFADTSAQAALPMAVPETELTRANGRVVGVQILGNDFAGAPLAGLLVTVLPAAVLGAPGLLYGVAGLLLLGMRGRFLAPREAPRPVAGEIAESLRYLWSHRFLRTLALSAGLINTAGAAYFGVLVLWVVGDGSPMGLAPSGYGLMLTVFAVGALAGSLVARPGRSPGRGRARLRHALGGLRPGAPGAGPAAGPLAAVRDGGRVGVSGAAANVLVISTRQRIIPGELLGRVNAAYRLLGMGGMPLGAALGGLAGEVAGLPAVFVGATVVQLLAVCWIGRVVFFPTSKRVTSGVTIPDITGSR
ncbi:MFS transporter [Nonomuraea ferruginea]